MEQLINFDFKGNQVRTVQIDDNPWFVGKDVSTILEYSRPQKAIKDLVDEEDQKTLVYKACPNLGLWLNNDFSNKTLINESGLYSLILSSTMPNAKQFKHWVTSEVLPSIRKNGAYLTNQKAYDITHDKGALADLLLQAGNQLKEAQAKIKEMQPKADYYDIILSNKSLMTVTMIAKDYGMTGTEFNEILHGLKIQYKQSNMWLLYKKYNGNGWTHSKSYIRTDFNGNKKVYYYTKWTQKGRLGLYKLLKEKGIIPMIEKE